MIERRLPCAALGVNQDELLGVAFQIIAIPETHIIVEPMRDDLGLVDFADSAPGGLSALVRFPSFFWRRSTFGRPVGPEPSEPLLSFDFCSLACGAGWGET